eukprot:CAMPEP_0185848334 /NCGR_PEP_ID=MMETSP1354-20130828/3259_1 /TAXON_ID=708628 /ORGANISM="Erythrolobus madagascarensis, Strain CCMP3276" /LENGTH=566 /DNA_ID=CAMNT_0028548723 /DNA_START=8 /DNA_END=1708 /DNA_ORIENTATION=+
MESRQEARRRGYKKGLDVDEARRKREDQSVSIRKVKREETIMKKRRDQFASAFAGSSSGADASAASTMSSSEVQEDEQLRQSLHLLRTTITESTQPDVILKAAYEVRKIVSTTVPPIDVVIEMGFVSLMVSMLQRDDSPALQFEAAWALTNIASGTSDQTAAVVDAGGVPHFVRLLSSPHDNVVEQAVWALGNIAGDSAHCRNIVLGAGVLPPLITKLSIAGSSGDQSIDPLQLLANCTWALSNLCRSKPPPPFEIVKVALPSLAHLLFLNDEQVLVDTAWTLSYLSDGSAEQVQAVIESGVTRRLVELLLHRSVRLQTPCLRAVGNLVTGDDLQTQIVINSSVLPCLLTLLSSPKKTIRMEACWTISNITAGNKQQIQAVLDAGLMEPVIRLLDQAEFDIKKEAAWAVANAASGGTVEQIMQLVKLNFLPPLCDLLDVSDPRLVNVVLEALEKVLRVTRDDNIVEYPDDILLEIEQCGGLDKLEALQTHENQDIYAKAAALLDEYFVAEGEDTLDQVAPAQGAADGQFAFGSVAPSAQQSAEEPASSSNAANGAGTHFSFNFAQQ